jgi:hypothetical protein
MAKFNMVSLLIIVIIIGLGFILFTRNDNRSGAERVGVAIEQMPNGLDKAADELQDKSPAEKILR